jgi:glycerophosphoryl diester phosphodiesterase
VERIAHRGAKREFPENTVAAFQRAFARGADAIELDVHATRDDVVIVHHDPTLRIAGRWRSSTPIAELSWDDVQTVRLAPDIGIPTLEDVLAVAPTGTTVYVEVKGANIEEAVAAVLALSATRCAVHSFDHTAISRMRDLAPGVPRGILFDRRAPDVIASMHATGARDVWPERRLIDAALVAAVHGAGGRVIAWTVNSRRNATTLAALGVDGLCTDDVRLLDAR